MKSASEPSFAYPDEPIPLLREAVEVLMAELSAVTAQGTENLPELKKRKVVIASRLRACDWSTRPSLPDTFDFAAIRSLIADLESQSRQQIQLHLEFIANRLLALQDEAQYWRECLSVSVDNSCKPIPVP